MKAGIECYAIEGQELRRSKSPVHDHFQSSVESPVPIDLLHFTSRSNRTLINHIPCPELFPKWPNLSLIDR